VRTFIVFEVSGKDNAELSREFSEPPPIMVKPQDIYAHLERHGHPDAQLVTYFRQLREIIESYVSDYVNHLYQEYGTKKVAVVSVLVADRDEQKRLINQYWYDLPLSIPTQLVSFKPPDVIESKFRSLVARVAFRLMHHPVLVPAREQPPAKNLTALKPHTAKVKLRIDDEIEEHTIETIPLPDLPAWMPEPRLNRPFEEDNLFFDDSPDDDDDGPPPASSSTTR